MKKIKTRCEVPAVQPHDGKTTEDTHGMLVVYSHEKCPDWVIVRLGEYQVTVNSVLLDQALRNTTSVPFFRHARRNVYADYQLKDDEEE